MLVIRGNKLTLFPLRDETLESFWRDTEDALASSQFGLEGIINELELSCLHLSNKMTDKLGLLLQQHAFTKISLQSCTATPALLDYFLKQVQSCCQLQCLESNGSLSDCWFPSSMQILEEIPLKTLRLLGMRFPRQVGSGDDVEMEMTSNAQSLLDTPKKPLHEDLQELDLTGCQWEQIESLLPFLQSCTSLQKVSFKCCRLEDAEIAQILAVLACLKQLETIDFGVNQCGPSGIHAVACLLESSSTTSSLQFLDLSYQVIPGGVAFSFERLAQALLANAKCKTPLKVLRLAGNQIQDAQLTSLAMALEHCRLERLDLSTNCISNQGLGLLSQGLVRNRHLKSINVRNNEFASLAMFRVDHNVSLHHVQHTCPPNCPNSGWVDYVCKLNRGGRILLRENELPQGLWPRVLARCCEQNNSDAMYYLLQQGQHR